LCTNRASRQAELRGDVLGGQAAAAKKSDYATTAGIKELFPEYRHVGSFKDDFTNP
jgi:hypothetical protein